MFLPSAKICPREISKIITRTQLNQPAKRSKLWTYERVSSSLVFGLFTNSPLTMSKRDILKEQGRRSEESSQWHLHKLIWVLYRIRRNHHQCKWPMAVEVVAFWIFFKKKSVMCYIAVQKRFCSKWLFFSLTSYVLRGVFWDKLDFVPGGVYIIANIRNLKSVRISSKSKIFRFTI